MTAHLIANEVIFAVQNYSLTHNTRNAKDLHVLKVKLESTKRGFQYAGIKAWNNIQIKTREISSLSLFKTHLKNYFMGNEN